MPQCVECGTTYDASLDSCPYCGCPASECPDPIEYANSVKDTGGSSYYYVDFDWFQKFSKDPWLLNFLISLKSLKWICAPWHIGGYTDYLDNDNQIANDIFFIINRLWKFSIYPWVWVACKVLPWLLCLVFILLLCQQFAPQDVYRIVFFILGMAIMFIYLLSVWLLFIAYGKAWKRYGVPMIAAVRHIILIVSKNIKTCV